MELKSLLNDLNNWGCNIESGLERLMDDQDLYVDLVNQFIFSVEIDKLSSSIKERNVKEAFDYVHNLKGVIGNLSLDPLYKPICGMTELLRKGSFEAIEVYEKEFLNKMDEIKVIINKNN